mmetsp:Transcript_22363/g.45634  ORF Transcript_22363/g.45634 Transcript_22363/m.45634 type:complete len:104 (+) Transcript_22363:244-555(+)
MFYVDPKMWAAGGFTPLQAVAGSGYVAHFLKYFRSPHEDAGKLMRVVLAWTRFQTGLPFPILSQPSTDMSYVDGRYFHSQHSGKMIDLSWQQPCILDYSTPTN